MKKIVWLIFGIIFLIIFVTLFNNFIDDKQKVNKDYLMGFVVNPKSIPKTSWEDITNAYEEAGDLVDVTMVWTGTNIGQTEKLKQSRLIEGLRIYDIKPILTLNFATIKKTNRGLEYVIDSPKDIEANLKNEKFRQAWINEAVKLVEEFDLEYISLGNEINDYFYLHPEDLNSYLSLYDEAYKKIKASSPETKVFVVFSYTHLIDNAQWGLVEKFNNRVDLIGLTTYPWKHFDSPGEIDNNYYSRLNDYTNKPIAFTEIGWISPPENEQAEFLMRFVNLTSDLDVEMINWLFLHEQDVSQGIGANIFDERTGSIGLKKADGTKKQVYFVWEELYSGENFTTI